MSDEAPARSRMWLHAASAGDVAALEPLALALLPWVGAPVRLSVVTATGAAMARRRFPDVPITRALCWPGQARRMARRDLPTLLVIERLELWPWLIEGAGAAGARVAIVNARLSERSLRRYRRLGRWFSPTVAALDRVCARSQTDADRFVALGVPEARVIVTGSTKYDAPAPHADGAERRALVLGSTHEGEERMLAPALARLSASRPIVVAPRYPRRASALRRELGDAVRVLDTVGDLRAAWAGARVAFVGGTLVARGGHDVLEPAACGAPVLFGPHVDAVAEEAAALLQAGAGRRIHDADELVAAVRAFEADADAGARARSVARHFTGASERCLRALGDLLPEPAPGGPC